MNSRTTQEVSSAKWLRLGSSVLGRQISAFHRGGVSSQASTALILGGMHGNEPKSVDVCRKLIELLESDPSIGSAVNWILIPLVNPDGFEKRKRRNARGVDLNRNFPTENWKIGNPRSRMYGGPLPASEPETKALIRAIDRFQPDWIITVHSIDRGRFCNNYDGPARKLAQKMARCNKYPVRASIGYATPGSFGAWAGVERLIPTITLELPSHHSAKRCWQDNQRALLCTL
jgi:protein MpaA